MSDPVDIRRQRVLRAAYKVEHDLWRLERSTLVNIRLELETARAAAIATIATATKDWQITQAKALLLDIEGQMALWTTSTTGIIGATYPTAADLGAEQVVAALKATNLWLPITPPRIDRGFLAVAHQTLPGLITDVADDVIRGVGRILRQAVLAGQTPLDAMHQIGRLTGRGPFSSAFLRGETILSTEMGRIASQANYATLNELARDHPGLQKEWSAVMDLRTRESHARADGQRVTADGDYHVGGWRAKYPHDPRLPAAETIRCRCVSLPWHKAWDIADERPGWMGLTQQAMDAGFSVSAWGSIPKTGAIVSPYEQRERKIPAVTFDVGDVHRYLRRNLDLLRLPEHYLGAWRSGDLIYLDVSVRAADLAAQKALGRQHGQLAGFDLATKETIWLREAVVPRLVLLDPDAEDDIIAGFVSELVRAV